MQPGRGNSAGRLASGRRYRRLLIAEPLGDICEPHTVQHHHRLHVSDFDHAIVAVGEILDGVWAAGQLTGAPPVLLKDRCHARLVAKSEGRGLSRTGPSFRRAEAEAEELPREVVTIVERPNAPVLHAGRIRTRRPPDIGLKTEAVRESPNHAAEGAV